MSLNSSAVDLTISGETGANAGYNGTWAVKVLSATTFSFTAPGNLTGDATPSNVSTSGFVENGTELYSQSVD